MAHPPTNFHQHITPTSPPFIQTDPFWQSSPPYNRSSMAALMRAIKQAVPPPPTGQRQRIPAVPQHTRRVGQCTHITMVRQHGNSACNMCGRPPSAGWLYACRQDWLLARKSQTAREYELPQLPIESDDLNHLADIATALGMSQSVLAQMRAGSYTVSEAKKVVGEKVHMLSVIEAEERALTQHSPSASPTSKTGLDSSSGIIASLGATVSSPTSSKAIDAAATITTNACNYMVCHTCRPFLLDRVTVSIEAILSGTEPAILRTEMQYLHMIEPNVVSKIGTRPTPPRRIRQFGLRLMDPTSQQKDGADEDTTPSDWTSSDISSGVCEDDDNEEFVNVDPFPCPGPGLCPVASYVGGCAYDSDFDDGERAINHAIHAGHHNDTSAGAENITPDRPRYRLRRVEGNVSETPGRAASNGSSISVPTPTTMPLTPVTPSDESFEDVLNSRIADQPPKVGKAATICGRLDSGAGGNMSNRPSSSSLGSEVAVTDGVALTEEAVETHLPDIKYEE
ncbi:hypothetical protein LTR95_012436 [Oleoguttula sp. CCFEE 5521]